MPRRTVRLTRLESEIMAVIWAAQPRAVRVRDVLDALSLGRKKPPAYNTIQTMLTILRDKGAVTVADGPGRAHLYSAAISRDDASRPVIGEMIERFFGGRAEPLLVQLLDKAELSPADLRRLRDWADSKLRDAEERSK